MARYKVRNIDYDFFPLRLDEMRFAKDYEIEQYKIQININKYNL